MKTKTKTQTKIFGPRAISGWGTNATITAEVRYDDRCSNGHNTFAITGEINRPNRQDCEACGMLHDEIQATFPELAPLLKWHLTSSDGPMHYVANTRYWAEQGNLEYARHSAVWPEASLDDLKDEQKLRNRLPELLKDFRNAIKFLGFTF